MKKNELLANMEKIHTTELGKERIKKNLSLDADDIVEWCKQRILNKKSLIARKGKNWYVSTDEYIITINAYSYTIITAHSKKH